MTLKDLGFPLLNLAMKLGVTKWVTTLRNSVFYNGSLTTPKSLAIKQFLITSFIINIIQVGFNNMLIIIQDKLASLQKYIQEKANMS